MAEGLVGGPGKREVIFSVDLMAFWLIQFAGKAGRREVLFYLPAFKKDQERISFFAGKAGRREVLFYLLAFKKDQERISFFAGKAGRREVLFYLLAFKKDQERIRLPTYHLSGKPLDGKQAIKFFAAYLFIGDFIRYLCIQDEKEK